MTDPRRRIQLSMPDDLHDILDALADADDRSTANFIVHVLTDIFMRENDARDDVVEPQSRRPS